MYNYNSLDYRAAYADEAQAHHLTRLKLAEAQRQLKSLLAVVNRDGGHRAETFSSMEEALYDAIEQICELRANAIIE